MTVTSILDLRITPESLADAHRIIEETLSATRAFDGNLGCDVIVDVTDPAHIAVIEHWESLEKDDAYRAWRATPAGASELGSITAERVLTRFDAV